MKTEIKVTRVGKLWVCRLSLDGKPWMQNWVKNRRSIGIACKDLMRWCDKLGNGNAHTDFARHRQLRDNEVCDDSPYILRSEWLQ